MKYLIGFIVVLVVAGAGVGYVYSVNKSSAAGAVSNVQTDTVTREDIEKTVTANGKVASNRDVDIKCQASGTIKELPYKDVSAEVKPEAVVCELDPQDEQRLEKTAEAVVAGDKARIQEAQLNWQIAKMALVTTRDRSTAALASAQARATDSHSKAERVQQLFASNLASKEDLETAQTAATQADSELQSAKAAIAELEQQALAVDAKEQTIKELEQSLAQDDSRLKTAQQNVDYCTVRAPKADNPSDPPRWFISSMLVNIAPGYVVQSGTSGFSAGTTIMTLSDLSHIFVLANVDDSDIGFVQDPNTGDGQLAKVSVDAYPGVEFDGVVRRVATKGVNTSNVVTFEVKIEVTDSKRFLLKPEMTATAKIIVASRPDALAIPLSAFTKGQSSDAPRNDNPPAATEPASANAADAAATEPGGRRGRGAGRRGGRRNAAPAIGLAALNAPVEGTVQVVDESGKQEARNVSVGIFNDDVYEVLSGLQEGETVVLNRSGADSRFRNPNPGRGGGLIPRGMGGGGRRGR
jgi:HlyD family secretion protein